LRADTVVNQLPPGTTRLRHDGAVHISARTEYGLRAMLALAAEPDGAPLTGESLADREGLPAKFLESIMADVRRAGLVVSRRGPGGGYRLARPATSVTVADVMRALDGPLADVRGLRPESVSYDGPAEHLPEVWVAARASLRSVLDHVSIADVVTGALPARVRKLTASAEAWHSG
jgi:Rrf2 family protein